MRIVEIPGDDGLRHPEVLGLSRYRRAEEPCTITLYDAEFDLSSYSVRLMLGLLGLPHRRAPIDATAGTFSVPALQRDHDLLAQLPVLTDGDLVLKEPLAILSYLARRYDWRDQWLPADDPVQLGQTLMWVARSVQTGAAADRHSTPGLRSLDDHLRKQESMGLQWFVSCRPTIADVAAFAKLALAHRGPVDASLPALRDWEGRFRELRGFAPPSSQIFLKAARAERADRIPSARTANPSPRGVAPPSDDKAIGAREVRGLVPDSVSGGTPQPAGPLRGSEQTVG